MQTKPMIHIYVDILSILLRDTDTDIERAFHIVRNIVSMYEPVSSQLSTRTTHRG